MNTKRPAEILMSFSKYFVPGVKKIKMGKRSYRKRLNRLRIRHCYTQSELADLLKVHLRTVQTWHKQGMLAIDESDRPFLFLGKAVKKFLRNRLQARKCRLRPGQFYCVRCNCARYPKSGTVRFEPTGKTMGKGDEQILVKGICGKCSLVLVQFNTRSRLSTGVWSMAFKKAGKILYGN